MTDEPRPLLRRTQLNDLVEVIDVGLYRQGLNKASALKGLEYTEMLGQILCQGCDATRRTWATVQYKD